MAAVAKWLRRRNVAPVSAGSTPVRRPPSSVLLVCLCSSPDRALACEARSSRFDSCRRHWVIGFVAQRQSDRLLSGSARVQVPPDPLVKGRIRRSFVVGRDRPRAGREIPNLAIGVRVVVAVCRRKFSRAGGAALSLSTENPQHR